MMSKLYESPKTNPETSSEVEAVPTFRTLAIIGSVLLAGPLFGFIGTIVGLIKAFSTLADSSADPSILAGIISLILMTSFYGAAFGLIGVILVSIALFRRTNREKWFFKCVFVISILWCILLFPLGLIIGVYLLVVFGNKKSEFYPPTSKIAQ